MKALPALHTAASARTAASMPARLVSQRRFSALPHLTVTLAAGETRVLENADEVVMVHCRSGQAWIAQEGDCQDVVLSAHQSFEPDCTGTLRLVALAPAVLEITSAEEVLLHA